ncbi:MAG: class I SAM-dependent methyltransferase [Desulfovibrionales bacterium]
MSVQKQDFGTNPIKVRETGHYQHEYIKPFVEKWDELIDWESRAENEGDFYIRELKKRGAKRVLDVATGTGFHSVRLLKAGFEVVSADGNPEMLTQAFNNARDHGEILRTVQADWRILNRDSRNNKFIKMTLKAWPMENPNLVTHIIFKDSYKILPAPLKSRGLSMERAVSCKSP